MSQKKTKKTTLSVIHSEDYAKTYDRRDLTHAGMIATAGRPRESLNGEWRFTPDACDTGLRSSWQSVKKVNAAGRPVPWDYDADHGDAMPVPSCWNLRKPEYFLYEGSAWYAKAFSALPVGADERLFLRVGAANYDAVVFLNGECLGSHRGGSTPFFVELSGAVKPDNLLQLCVNNTRTADRVPMRNIDWFNYGGIYRDVELFRVPREFIRDFRIHLVPDGRFNRIAVSVTVSDEKADDWVQIRIPELKIEQSVRLRRGRAEAKIPAAPELWEPGSPKRYEVAAHFRNDILRERVGFREIRARGTDILLNGKPLFLRGICVHEDDTALGKCATREDMLRRFAHAKELGCNFLRLAHYPHHEMAAELADEAGLMLWEEIPVYWAVDFANRATYVDAQNQLLELIRRDCNRASVIIWSVGNENPDTDARLKFMSGLARTAKKADPSRPVSAACLINHAKAKIDDRLIPFLDIVGINEYYGWYSPDFEELVRIGANFKAKKPVIISETGACAAAGHHGPKGEIFTEEYMENVYRQQVAILRKLKYVRGLSPWILYDFRSPKRMNRFQQGYNRKGLMAADKRTRKRAFGVLQAYYREIKNTMEKR